ncbi:metal ABC transporter substrate-binding protein [Cellulomonas sp. Root137]|uniref:metal ABC transporter substrate-binding protein n=1 Tax=Cellulomonas sp. Root137 TaxID=1736459 RepID=UPI0006F27394|nr:metal ABC transporter substrate-binding protein [Cellulomonas sp. Root137]KQY48264.1 ABC transporter substrate-binding protein [Cellulomonas sp. Root137]
MSIAPRRLALLAPLAALPLVLTGCASASGADDGTVDVMASFYPLQFVAEQVGGDRVTVRSLTPPGAEPHDVELSPAQVSRIDGADLVVYLSGFQAAVDDAVAQTSPAHVVDAASDTTLRPADHEDESEEEHAEHEHGDLDPHFWLDPSRMPSVVEDVAATLTEIDPDGAEAFAANAAALSQRFEDLDATYAAGLQQCDVRTFVTSHEAFGYLADRYDLEQVGISGIDPEAEPSPARLAAVETIVRDEDVSTIFFESLVSPKVAETLADDLGITTAVLDPVEGLADPDADYFSIATANLEALRMALSCS